MGTYLYEKIKKFLKPIIEETIEEMLEIKILTKKDLSKFILKNDVIKGKDFFDFVEKCDKICDVSLELVCVANNNLASEIRIRFRNTQDSETPFEEFYHSFENFEEKFEDIVGTKAIYIQVTGVSGKFRSKQWFSLYGSLSNEDYISPEGTIEFLESFRSRLKFEYTHELI